MDRTKKIITIKRYSNRKLYDMSQSRYITLAELGELIRRGETIEVIDNETKADLTDVTLTQVLMAQQKQKHKGIRNLVQTQAEILLQRISVPVQQIRDEALRQVERFKRKTDDECGQENNAPSQSMITRLDALKASSDEKILTYLIVQRLEQVEAEVVELRRRIELLERENDDMF